MLEKGVSSGLCMEQAGGGDTIGVLLFFFEGRWTYFKCRLVSRPSTMGGFCGYSFVLEAAVLEE